MLFNPSTAYRLISPAQTMSLDPHCTIYQDSSAFCLTAFSEIVGIASPLMKNVLSTTFPLTIEMLLDLEGFNCIRGHSVLSVNLPNN